MSSHSDADLAAVFVRWTWSRAVFHRGWWLVTSVYLVVDAHLAASQLVVIGAAQAAVGLAFEARPASSRTRSVAAGRSSCPTCSWAQR